MHGAKKAIEKTTVSNTKTFMIHFKYCGDVLIRIVVADGKQMMTYAPRAFILENTFNSKNLKTLSMVSYLQLISD